MAGVLEPCRSVASKDALWFVFLVLRGPIGLPLGSRRGGAYHAGEARAMAALARRIAARPQSWAAGQADAMAILMRRTLMRTSAPA